MAGTREAEILALLKKRPMTSYDIVQATKATNAAIYTVLSVMRKKGLIETREDPATGEKVNAVKA